METKTKKRIKLIFIALGAILVIGTPIITISSLYIQKTNKTPNDQNNLINFYSKEEAQLFDQTNFWISTPAKTGDKYLVDNVTIANIIFNKKDELKNHQYDIKIIEVLPDSLNATLKFKYKVFSIQNPLVEITRESNYSYSEFKNDFGENQLFSK